MKYKRRWFHYIKQNFRQNGQSMYKMTSHLYVLKWPDGCPVNCELLFSSALNWIIYRATCTYKYIHVHTPTVYYTYILYTCTYVYMYIHVCAFTCSWHTHSMCDSFYITCANEPNWCRLVNLHWPQVPVCQQTTPCAYMYMYVHVCGGGYIYVCGGGAGSPPKSTISKSARCLICALCKHGIIPKLTDLHVPLHVHVHVHVGCKRGNGRVKREGRRNGRVCLP